MRHELFIYYRSPAARADAFAVHAHSMQRDLAAAHPGLQTRLLRRATPSAADVTWMETYVLPPGAEPAVLIAAIDLAAHALRPWIAGERHVEHFVPCAS